MKLLKKIILIIVAVVVGEALLALLITMVQGNLLGGFSFQSATTSDFLIAGIGTFLAAVVAGIVVYLIVLKKHIVAHVIFSVLLTIESMWLIFIKDGGSEDPLWFDFAGYSSLIIGIWLFVIIHKWNFRRKVNSSPGNTIN